MTIKNLVYHEGRFAVEEKWSYDNPPKKFYRILMNVSPNGMYIDLDASEGIFSSKENAINKAKELKNEIH
jgi:hypothetical protein